MCLLGMGAGAALETCWALIASSAIGADKVTMPDEERCGGIGLGRATVVIVRLIVMPVFWFFFYVVYDVR